MPIYQYVCHCGYRGTEMFPMAARPDTIPCPRCGETARYRIGVSSADCFSERPAWISSVADMANPSGGAAEREFISNRTRENYHRFMQERGLRHVEPGERLGKTGNPVDMVKLTNEVYERQRERNKIHLP